MAIGHIDDCNPCPSTHSASASALQVGARGHVLERSAILRTFWYVNAIWCTMIQYSLIFHRACTYPSFVPRYDDDPMFLRV